MRQITLNKVDYVYDMEWILEGSNLMIQQGDGCILLIGKNGAGKNTLLNVACGFLPPDYGDLSRSGTTIGYLPYEHPLYRHLTVLGNPQYSCRYFHGKNLGVRDAVVQEILQALSIDYLNQRIDQCSSGQEQKVGIACIPLDNADMTIVDESFIVIDARSNEGLCKLISKKCGNTVLLITSHTSSGISSAMSRLLTLDDHHPALDTRDRRKIMRYLQPEEDTV